jgi:hypothetical protein
VINLRNFSRENNLDLRANAFLTPHINFAAHIFGGDDTADNGKAKTSASLKRVFLGKRMEKLVLYEKMMRSDIQNGGFVTPSRNFD